MKVQAALIRRKRQIYYHWVSTAAKYLALLILAYCSYKYIPRITHATYLNATNKLAEVGFRVQKIQISKCQHFDVKQLVNKYKLSSKTPILSLTLSNIKAEIQKDPWVDKVLVKRILPDTLNIQIREKPPAAIWQNKGKLYLVSPEGEVITNHNNQFNHLPLVIGEGANCNLALLNRLISGNPWIKSNLKHAIWQGKRRWDLHFHSGLTIKLPENRPEDAIAFLERQFKEELLPNLKIKTIDLRDKEKCYIETFK